MGEVVKGSTNGQPMPTHRTAQNPGLSLGIRRERMTNGAAWVDLTWPEDRQDLASELVYVK